MDQATENRLKNVHPELARRVTLLLVNFAIKGVEMRVTQGLRTYAEQDAIFAQGRNGHKGKIVTNAKGGQSFHNFGIAVDLCPFVDGKARFDDEKAFDSIGEEALIVGLEWGGNWKKIKDRPHIQLGGISIKECQALYSKGGLKAVWAEVNFRLHLN
jgi:peptidoglycan L-alanyl-D-glutamate endopeptidase CwlK